ncbi:MAG: aryl-sulfate sulfotransferase [Candidatus Thermoplasmatota archaeon]|nr:aryl-sulfate sulfotransferase [Candidatus Thermoplasmatota archaeon]
MFSSTTYLIEPDGSVNHTWSSTYFPGIGVRWLGEGTILRSIRVGASGTGGAGGGVQKVLWDGTITWDFRYNNDGVLSHHDILPLPNGNVLMIAWEIKTRQEAINQGRIPEYWAYNSLWPDHVIEVQPTGITSGEIVWEWHVWDHLIQDYDSEKPNYGVVADHPELININYGGSGYDWLHTNSIDYNEALDQILLSVNSFNEIWVIDHSTTTQEAAGHSGGNSGKGGDLLYRWGNPQAYNRGEPVDQQLFGQHDATWIDPGLPGEGHILIFNNGVNRPGTHYSSVDEIIPPVDQNGSYALAAGSAYGPETYTWRYTGTPVTSFYALRVSGAERLLNGNTLICDGFHGTFFEVTPAGSTVWQYINPYPGLYAEVFKIVYIPPQEPPQPHVPDLYCMGSLSWTNVKTGQTVAGSFDVQNIGANQSLLNWTVNTSSLEWGTWTFTPASGTNLKPEDGAVTVQVSVVAPGPKNTQFEGVIRVENQKDPSDFGEITVSLKTPVTSEPVWFPLLHMLRVMWRRWVMENYEIFDGTYIGILHEKTTWR